MQRFIDLIKHGVQITVHFIQIAAIFNTVSPIAFCQFLCHGGGIVKLHQQQVLA